MPKAGYQIVKVSIISAQPGDMFAGLTIEEVEYRDSPDGQEARWRYGSFSGRATHTSWHLVDRNSVPTIEVERPLAPAPPVNVEKWFPPVDGGKPPCRYCGGGDPKCWYCQPPGERKKD